MNEEKLICGCGGEITIDTGGFGPVNEDDVITTWFFECDKCNTMVASMNCNSVEEAIAAFKKATRAEGCINWIPVSERLPQNGQMVIIYCPQFVGLPVDIIEWWENAENDLEDITHWAEINLPEAKP